MKKTTLLIPTLLVTLGFGAGFDCKKASTPTEKTICSNQQLSTLDSKLTKLYKKVLNSYKVSDESTGMCRQCVYNNNRKMKGCEDVCNDSRDGIRDDQRDWMKVRDKCGTNVNCLDKTMNSRIKTLNDSFYD